MMTWVVFAAAEREAANAKYLREEKLKGFMKRLRARLEKLPLARAFSSMRTAIAYMKIEEINERIRLEKVTLLTKQVCARARQRAAPSRVHPLDSPARTTGTPKDVQHQARGGGGRMAAVYRQAEGHRGRGSAARCPDPADYDVGERPHRERPGAPLVCCGSALRAETSPSLPAQLFVGFARWQRETVALHEAEANDEATQRHMRHVINSAVRRLTQAGYTRGFNTWRALVQAAHAAADKLELLRRERESKQGAALATMQKIYNSLLARTLNSWRTALREAKAFRLRVHRWQMKCASIAAHRSSRRARAHTTPSPSLLSKVPSREGIHGAAPLVRILDAAPPVALAHAARRLAHAQTLDGPGVPPLAHDDAVRAARAQQRVAPSPAREAQFSREPRRFAVGARRRLATKQRATRATHRRNVDGPLRKDGVERLVRLRPGLCIVARLLARRAPKGMRNALATTLPLRRTRA